MPRALGRIQRMAQSVPLHLHSIVCHIYIRRYDLPLHMRGLCLIHRYTYTASHASNGCYHYILVEVVQARGREGRQWGRLL